MNMTADHDKRGMQCDDRLDIEFGNLCYFPPGKKVKSSAQKQILRNAAGRFNSGRLTAILGPSGAGKTSLMNVLSGFKTHGVSGSITVNGKPRNLPKFRKLSCYIKQEFAMLELLTTRETMVFASDFKMNPSVSKQQKSIIIEEILEILGLEKSAHTLVGALSGGEQKRLSIGLELLTNPPVMFVDEPTSGLDSSSALQIMSHLKSLAQGGRTVVCVIHQPSSQIFQMFDDVYVLSQGQCVYNGPNENMTKVFEEEGFQCPKFYSIADFAIEIASGQRGDTSKLIAKFNNNEDYLECQQNGETDETSRLNPVELHSPHNIKEIAVTVEEDAYLTQNYPQHLWKQIFILMKRSMLCTLRDKVCIWFRVLAHIGFGLILGCICFDIGNDASKVLSNVALLFFFTVFLFFCNLMSLLQIPTETPVFLHEHLNNWYSLKAYYISKLCADIPIQILCPTLLFATGYVITDQPLDGIRWLQFWNICILMSFLGHHSGLIVGAVCKTLEVAMFTCQVINVVLLLFCGFYVAIEDISIWLRWLTHVSYFRYAFEGALQCIYGYDRPNMECKEIYCYFKSPRTLLDQFYMADAVYEYDVLMLLLWIAILWIVLFLALKWRIYTSQ